MPFVNFEIEEDLKKRLDIIKIQKGKELREICVSLVQQFVNREERREKRREERKVEVEDKKMKGHFSELPIKLTEWK